MGAETREQGRVPGRPVLSNPKRWGGGRGSGNHPPEEDGLQVFEVCRVGWVKTSTRLEARGFGG